MKAIVFLLCLFLLGCAAPKANLTPETEEGRLDALKTGKIIEKIYETNLLITGFIIVVAIGVFCCLSRQLQIGLALIGTGSAGIWITRTDQALAQNHWLLLIPTGIAVVGAGVWVFKNEQIRTALREIIKGGKRMGLDCSEEEYHNFKVAQKFEQSKSTEKIVRDLKAKM